MVALVRKPGLLLSSGPSLEDADEIIKGFKGISFCLAPSLNYVLSKNIIPDYVILGDSKFENLLHVSGALSRKINLICDLSIHPALLALWQGLKY